MDVVDSAVVVCPAIVLSLLRGLALLTHLVVAVHKQEVEIYTVQLFIQGLED